MLIKTVSDLGVLFFKQVFADVPQKMKDSTYALYSRALNALYFLSMSDAFPRNLVEFTERFASEEACMVYLMTIKLRHIKKTLNNKNKVHKYRPR